MGIIIGKERGYNVLAQNKNCIGGKKGFSVAFSIKADKPINILDKAIRSEDNVKINNYEEFYIIGVIINDQ